MRFASLEAGSSTSTSHHINLSLLSQDATVPGETQTQGEGE